MLYFISTVKKAAKPIIQRQTKGEEADIKRMTSKKERKKQTNKHINK